MGGCEGKEHFSVYFHFHCLVLIVVKISIIWYRDFMELQRNCIGNTWQGCLNAKGIFSVCTFSKKYILRILNSHSIYNLRQIIDRRGYKTHTETEVRCRRNLDDQGHRKGLELRNIWQNKLKVFSYLPLKEYTITLTIIASFSDSGKRKVVNWISIWWDTSMGKTGIQNY